MALVDGGSGCWDTVGILFNVVAAARLTLDRTLFLSLNTDRCCDKEILGSLQRNGCWGEIIVPVAPSLQLVPKVVLDRNGNISTFSLSSPSKVVNGCVTGGPLIFAWVTFSNVVMGFVGEAMPVKYLCCSAILVSIR